MSSALLARAFRCCVAHGARGGAEEEDAAPGYNNDGVADAAGQDNTKKEKYHNAVMSKKKANDA